MDVQTAAQWKSLSVPRANANDVEQEWQVPHAPGAGWRTMRYVGRQLATEATCREPKQVALGNSLLRHSSVGC
jgi:hypothetical protein